MPSSLKRSANVNLPTRLPSLTVLLKLSSFLEGVAVVSSLSDFVDWTNCDLGPAFTVVLLGFPGNGINGSFSCLGPPFGFVFGGRLEVALSIEDTLLRVLLVAPLILSTTSFPEFLEELETLSGNRRVNNSFSPFYYEWGLSFETCLFSCIRAGSIPVKSLGSCKTWVLS